MQFTIAVTAVGCKHRIRCIEVELTAARKNMPDDIRCTLFSQTVRWLAVIRVDLHVFIVPACADRQILQTKAVQQYAIFLCNIHHGLLDFRCGKRMPCKVARLAAHNFDEIFDLLFHFTVDLVVRNLIQIFQFAAGRRNKNAVFIHQCRDVLRVAGGQPGHKIQVLTNRNMRILFQLVHRIAGLCSIVCHQAHIGQNPAASCAQAAVGDAVGHGIIGASYNQFHLFLLSYFRSRYVISSTLLRRIQFFTKSEVNTS